MDPCLVLNKDDRFELDLNQKAEHVLAFSTKIKKQEA